MKKHIRYYLSLGVLFLSAFILVLALSSSTQLQFVVVILTTVLYVILGVLHHIEHHSVSVKIVLEYVLFAGLGIAICYLVITSV